MSLPSSTKDNNNENINENEHHNEAMQFLKIANIEPSNFSTLTKLDIFGAGMSSLPINLPKILPNLKTLFLMKNEFTEVPAVIGSCPNLDMVSFKSNKITTIHPEALQPQMRWLILTDNQIKRIPSSIGRCCKLQKFMLSGNQIESLPKEIESCVNLELIRMASNRLQEPPMSLLSLPNLAWVALSDNPFLESVSKQVFEKLNLSSLDSIDVEDEMGDILGKGASGITRKVLLTNGPDTEYVAVKKYSSSITSDGNPFEERRATLAASSLRNSCFVQLLGQNKNGSLVMKLLVDFMALGNPPSFQTCSRDVYDEDLELTSKEALLIAAQLLEALERLHCIGLSHGDFYAHNILVSKNDNSVVKLTDFGAAFFYEKKTKYGDLVQKIEMRAFGHLLEELIILMKRSDETSDSLSIEKKLQTTANYCLENDSEKRCFMDLLSILSA